VLSPTAGVRCHRRSSETIRGFSLTPDERADLVAFFRALSDDALLRDARFADPWPAARER
jgi:cytochrome c peroxidase